MLLDEKEALKTLYEKRMRNAPEVVSEIEAEKCVKAYAVMM